MLNFTVYCDESYDTNTFCIAGWAAPLAAWTALDLRWTEVLQEEGIKEFKASDCEHRRGEFKGWLDPTERERAYGRFVDVLSDSILAGVWVTADVQAFPDSVWRDFRSAGISSPYLWLFGFEVTSLTKFGLEATLFQRQMGISQDHEYVAFVFDRQDEWSGRALQFFNLLKSQHSHRPEAAHIGGISFGDSALLPGLQAADLLAYEARRFTNDVATAQPRGHPRWQWEKLNAVVPPRAAPPLWGRHMSQDAFKRMNDYMANRRTQEGG